MEEKFNVMLRHPKVEKGSAEMDMDKPPTLTVKIPCWKGVWQSEIYDEESQPLFIKGKSPSHVSPLDFFIINYDFSFPIQDRKIFLVFLIVCSLKTDINLKLDKKNGSGSGV